MICILLPGPCNGNQIPSLPCAKHLDSEVLQNYMTIKEQRLVWDLSVTEPLIIKKRGNWGTLEKLPNRGVRYQCLWVTAEIKHSALFEYKIFWIKLCLIIWILHLRKLSWMLCSPTGSKTRQAAYLTQKKNRVTFKNVAKIICTHSLFLYVYISIYLATIHLTFWEKSKKKKEELSLKGLS